MSLLLILSIFLGVVGTAFVLLATIGIVVMPDLYCRMQAASKAATLGASCLLLAAAAIFGETGIAVRAAMIIAFLSLTLPVAAHLLARAGYSAGVPLSPETRIDELHDSDNTPAASMRKQER